MSRGTRIFSPASFQKVTDTSGLGLWNNNTPRTSHSLTIDVDSSFPYGWWRPMQHDKNAIKMIRNTICSMKFIVKDTITCIISRYMINGYIYLYVKSNIQKKNYVLKTQTFVYAITYSNFFVDKSNNMFPLSNFLMFSRRIERATLLVSGKNK